jgi:hypothetical protein
MDVNSGLSAACLSSRGRDEENGRLVAKRHVVGARRQMWEAWESLAEAEAEDVCDVAAGAAAAVVIVVLVAARHRVRRIVELEFMLRPRFPSIGCSEGLFTWICGAKDGIG